MAGKNDFYGGGSGIKEIDLRTEMNHTILGTNCPPEIGKGQPGLLRKFRQDSNGEKILCHCVDKVTGEATRESRCSTCLGEKYLWDEEHVDFYVSTVETESQLADRENLRMDAVHNTPFFVFHIPAQYDLTDGDKIVRLVLDREGNPVQPLKRRDVYRLAALRDMRLDNGRLEFWKAEGYKDNIKHL
jgi:hypothetical protein